MTACRSRCGNTLRSVKADASGGFTHTFDLPIWFVANYTVTATGQLPGRACGLHRRLRRERLRPRRPDGRGRRLHATTSTPRARRATARCARPSTFRTRTPCHGHHGPAGTYTLSGRRTASIEDNDDGDLDVRASVSINGAGRDGSSAGTPPANGRPGRAGRPRLAPADLRPYTST